MEPKEAPTCSQYFCACPVIDTEELKRLQKRCLILAEELFRVENRAPTFVELDNLKAEHKDAMQQLHEDKRLLTEALGKLMAEGMQTS
jgi:hypothetical protein